MRCVGDRGVYAKIAPRRLGCRPFQQVGVGDIPNIAIRLIRLRRKKFRSDKSMEGLNSIPLWMTGLITLAVCSAGGAFVCIMFALGIKSGFKDWEKENKSKDENKKLR